MATTTTNFGWDIPQSTDLVKDGATAIATLGQDIDTSMVDLKGGTTGQVLSKTSNTDMDFTWITSTANSYTLLATGSPSGGVINFTSISGTYKKLVLIIEDWYINSAQNATLRFNSDTGANYGSVGLYGTNGAATNAYTTGQTYAVLTPSTCATTDNNNLLVAEIPNYADTDSHKLVYCWAKYEGNSGGTNVSQSTAYWKSTSAITAIQVYPSGGSFVGTAYLYGVN